MALTTAERNRRKRERKKREREERRRLEEEEAKELAAADPRRPEEEVEVEYVAEELVLPPTSVSGASGEVINGEAGVKVEGERGEGGGDDEGIAAVLRRFQSRSSVTVTDDEAGGKDGDGAATDGEEEGGGGGDDDEGAPSASSRRLREAKRPTVAELKNRVARSDLVEAHDVTAPDPDFLLQLKSVPGTVPVPRHWGRKRKYLQGKRGVEKPLYQLPDFIIATGISEVRDAADDDQDKMSARQKNRARVSGKGGMDIDYRVMHDAFFKHQSKPRSLTGIGDLYYEGKEYETTKSKDLQVGRLSERLREALDMKAVTAPPPWLVNMQRYGPPPSYPNLKIPGLNCPIPQGCSYGYHVGGWGKPPVDVYGRPLYGGNPFDRPTAEGGDVAKEDGGPHGTGGGADGLVTSDGKAICSMPWGGLPMGEQSEEESSDEEEESSDEDMAESSSEEEEGEEQEGPGSPLGATPGAESVLPPGVNDSVLPASAIDLRKAPGTETPAGPQKQLYQVIGQTTADGDAQAGAVFKSDVAYVLPGSDDAAAPRGVNIPEGAESVLSKAPMDAKSAKRKHGSVDDDDDDDDDDGDLGKKFKF